MVAILTNFLLSEEDYNHLENGKTGRRVETNIVGLMVAFSVMSYFDRTIMSIAGPGMMKEFALSDPQMGGGYTAFLISYAAMNLPGGYLADRFGSRLVLTATGLGAALFTALTALGGKPGIGVYLGVVPSFFLLRFALGICTGPLYPTCARTMASWISPIQHGRVQGFIAAGAGLGGATSPILFSWMIGHYGWRMSFCIAGIATAILALIWFWYVRDHPSQHPSIVDANNTLPPQAETSEHARKANSTPWARLLTDGNLILLSFSYFAVNYFSYIDFFWIYYYLGEIRHLGPSQSAVATTTILLTWTAMSPLGEWSFRPARETIWTQVGTAYRSFCGVNSRCGSPLHRHQLDRCRRQRCSVVTLVWICFVFGWALLGCGDRLGWQTRRGRVWHPQHRWKSWRYCPICCTGHCDLCRLELGTLLRQPCVVGGGSNLVLHRPHQDVFA